MRIDKRGRNIRQIKLAITRHLRGLIVFFLVDVPVPQPYAVPVPVPVPATAEAAAPPVSRPPWYPITPGSTFVPVLPSPQPIPPGMRTNQVTQFVDDLAVAVRGQLRLQTLLEYPKAALIQARRAGRVVYDLGVRSYSPIIYHRKVADVVRRLGVMPAEVVVFLDVSDIQDDAEIYEETPGLKTAME